MGGEENGQLRCPECQLVLGFADDSPADLLICPACGAEPGSAR